MTPTMNTNGRAKQTLASQIDRLDNMLDGLADGINETVVTAVQEAIAQAVRDAVQAAVKEVLTNPVLQQRLQPVHVEAAKKPATVAERVVQTGRRALSWLGSKLKTTWHGTVAAVHYAYKKTCQGVCSVANAVSSRVRQAYQWTRRT